MRELFEQERSLLVADLMIHPRFFLDLAAIVFECKKEEVAREIPAFLPVVRAEKYLCSNNTLVIHC